MKPMPWYHYPWTWYFIGVLGFSVISGTALILIAAWQADEVVVTDYYRQGLAINQDLASQQWAKTLQMQAQLYQQGNQLVVQLNQPAQQVELRLLSNRGSDFDRHYPLQRQHPDWHQTPLQGIDNPEQVMLRLQGISQGRLWVMEQKLRWPAQNLVLNAVTD